MVVQAGGRGLRMQGRAESWERGQTTPPHRPYWKGLKTSRWGWKGGNKLRAQLSSLSSCVLVSFSEMFKVGCGNGF